jgi:hypothetical protein
MHARARKCVGTSAPLLLSCPRAGPRIQPCSVQRNAHCPRCAPRGPACVSPALLNDRYLYVFGGWDGQEELGDLHMFDMGAWPPDAAPFFECGATACL